MRCSGVRMWTIVLLVISNAFMTYAWYGHLKHFESKPLWTVILISWGIAFFEYCFMVPANRIGKLTYNFDFFQLKIMQEVITLAVFTIMAWLIFGQTIRWNHGVAFALILAAVYFAFKF